VCVCVTLSERRYCRAVVGTAFVFGASGVVGSTLGLTSGRGFETYKHRHFSHQQHISLQQGLITGAVPIGHDSVRWLQSTQLQLPSKKGELRSSISVIASIQRTEAD